MDNYLPGDEVSFQTDSGRYFDSTVTEAADENGFVFVQPINRKGFPTFPIFRVHTDRLFSRTV